MLSELFKQQESRSSSETKQVPSSSPMQHGDNHIRRCRSDSELKLGLLLYAKDQKSVRPTPMFNPIIEPVQSVASSVSDGSDGDYSFSLCFK